MGKAEVSRPLLGVSQYAILFTDLQGSSVLNQRIGDVLYREQVLYPHFRELQQAAAERDGHQSGDPAGDSMMFVFADIAQAIEAAVTIQEGMRDHPSGIPDGSRVATRIGIHYSKKQLHEHESFRFSGNSDCNYAARVMGIAQGGQILLSQEAYDAAQTARTDWKEWPNRLIKSFEEAPRTVYELCWDAQTSKGEPGAQFLPDWYVIRNEYISRTDLEAEIVGYFNPKRSDRKFTRLVTLHGFGGMGKTRLAMQCAVQMVGAFEGRVRFVPLGRAVTEILTGEQNRCDLLAQAIGKAFAPERDAATSETLLSYVPTTTTLLLLDNWETVEGTLSAKLVASLLLQRPNLAILVTGRQCVHIDDMEQEVPVEGMSLSEARDLFLARLRQKKEYANWTPNAQDEATIKPILTTLEGIALAIELVAANSAGRVLSLVAQEIKKRVLSENTARRRGHISSENAPRHASLQASLDWSWELIEEQVQYALCCVSLFAQPFSETEARQIFPQMTAAGMMGLRDAALMQFVPGNIPVYSLLRVTREYAEEKRQALEGTVRDQIEMNFIMYYKILMVKYRRGVYEHHIPTLVAIDSIHLNVGTAFLHAVYRSDYENATYLYNTLCQYQYYRSLLTDKLSLEEAMLKFRLKVLPDGHPDIANSLNNLAIVYLRQNRYSEAEPLFVAALAINRNILPEAPLLIANTLNNLAGLYDRQGRYSDAESAFVEALEIYRRILPESHADIASALNNLAALYDGQGRYSEAEILYVEALAIHRVALPNGHPDVANTLNNLAIVYLRQGRYIEAEPRYLEALAINRHALPPKHPLIANSLNNLAAFYDNRGRYSEAEPLFIEALAIDRVALPQGHPDIANTLNNMALLYCNQGRYREAKILYIEALAINRSALLADHPTIANTLNNLAGLYVSQGQYSEAEPLFIEALAIRRSFLPEGHPDIANTLNNLAALYDIQGKYSEAEPLFIECLRIRRSALPAGHPDIANVLNNLAALYKRQDRYSAAEALLQEELGIRRTAMPEGHPSIADSLNNLAWLHKNNNQPLEAVPLMKEALQILMVNLGNEHPYTKTVQANYAELSEQIKNWSEAEERQ